MNKELYKTEKFSVEEGRNENYVLEYYLTQDQHTFKTGCINYVCYGVEVRMRQESDSQYCEIQSADEIFSSKDTAIKFLDKLASGKVTPCTLGDVVSDMLSEALA